MGCPRLVACAVVLILGVASTGCTGAEKTTAAAEGQVAGQPAAQGDGIHEYRAVCIEKKLHDGNEYVLSRWLDTREQAQSIGDYHSWFKYKGHQIRIEERLKPTKVKH